MSQTGYFDSTGDWHDGAADLDPTLEFDSHSVTAHLNWKLPRFTLTAIGGYDDFDKDQVQDLDVSPDVIGNNETISNEVESFSLEARLTSDESWGFSWIVGAFYFDSEINWFQTIDLSDFAIPTSNGADQDTDSWAVFADVVIPFAEQFEFEGGIRYTQEDREWEGGSFIGTLPSLAESFASGAPVLSALPIPPGGTAGGDMPGGPLDFDNSQDEDNTDFRLGLNYRPNDDMMFWFSVSEAFRSGGYSSAVIFSQAALEPFGPEELRAYEAGLKTNLLDNRLQFNISGYFYDFEDYQATFVRGQEVSARLQNAGDVEIYGVEATFKWLVTESLLLDGAINWLDNEIVDTDVVLAPLDGGPPTTIEGNEIANAPEWMINGRGQYDLSIGADYESRFQLDFTWVDDHYLEPNNREVLSEGGYFVLNGRVGIGPNDGPWEVALWGKNLTDEDYLTAAQDIIVALGFAERSINLPRTWGAELIWRF